MAKLNSSLRDVAQAAGVSLGTASRALNNKSNVLPATRALVLKAAADLGYKLQIRIPTAVASKIHTIGVVVKREPGGYPRIDPFYYAVLCGIEDECERLGLSLMYASVPVNDFSHVATWSPILENGDIDGLVIVGVVLQEAAVTARIPQNIPVVLVDAFASGLQCDRILTHNFQGAYDAVSFLIAQKHSRIGLIGSSLKDAEHPSIRERRQGYLQALADHGIDSSFIADSLLQGNSARIATQELLKQFPEITAIFACNDDVAWHVIRTIRDMGRRVPQDISVIGFDDKAVGEDESALLTTMQVDKELMGELAVRHLYERAVNRERPPITTIIGTRLVIRDTVAGRGNGQVTSA